MGKFARKKQYEKGDIVVVQFPEQTKRTMWGKLGEEKLDSPIIAKVKSKSLKKRQGERQDIYFLTLPFDEHKYTKQDLSFFKELFSRTAVKDDYILGLFDAKATLKGMMDG